jgi:gliding motility associated protien GldN
MKKLLLLFFAALMICCLNSRDTLAQFVNNGIYEKENIPGKKPVPYPSLREADVLWSKQIWRIIDLRHKMNHPLYFPTTPIGERMSLFDVILTGVKNGEIQAFSPDYDNNEFKVPIGFEQIKNVFDAGIDTLEVPDPQTGGTIKKVVTKEIRSDEVKQFIIKEQWYFDIKYSTMRVRVIGICPVRIWEETDDMGDVVTRKAKTFWIYYPEARPVLARHEIFNPKNDARSLSYDDLFFKRKFNSYIQKESNVYDNRLITEYMTGINAVLESERIKQEIFQFELDLWEY